MNHGSIVGWQLLSDGMVTFFWWSPCSKGCAMVAVHCLYTPFYHIPPNWILFFTNRPCQVIEHKCTHNYNLLVWNFTTLQRIVVSFLLGSACFTFVMPLHLNWGCSLCFYHIISCLKCGKWWRCDQPLMIRLHVYRVLLVKMWVIAILGIPNTIHACKHSDSDNRHVY